MATGLVGLLLQYTVRDRIAGLAVPFYGLPPLVIVMASLLSAGLLSRRSSLRWVLLAVAASGLAIVTWIRTDYAHASPLATAGDLRIILWNVGARSDQAPVARVVKETGAPVVLLLESGYDNNYRARLWKRHLPNHSISFLTGGAMLLSEYPVSRISAYAMGKRTRIHTCELRTPSGVVSLVIVDIESNLFSSRGPLVARAYDIATSVPSPTIVLGDFNTPHTSAFFREFRQAFRHAFESSGSGLIPTWPSLCPVLALDHVWLSADILPVHTRTLRTFHSDHALVIADVRLNPARPVSPSQRKTRE